MSNDVHRIDLGRFDIEDAEALEAEAQQYRVLAESSEDSATLLAEAEAAEARAVRLREQRPHAGQWVDVKPRRNYGDRLAIASARVRIEQGPLGITQHIDTVGWTLAKLDRAVVGWSVAWWNGAPPARQAEGMSAERRAALEEIDEDIGPRLVAAIDEHYASQVRGDADTKG